MRKRLTNIVLPTMVQDVLNPLLKSLKQYRFAITTDGWEKPASTPALISQMVEDIRYTEIVLILEAMINDLEQRIPRILHNTFLSM